MQPFTSFHETLDVILRYICVYGIVAVAFFLDVMVFPAPFSAVMTVPFLFITIFYWAIFRPTLLSPFLIFVLGLLFDSMTGGILGYSSVVFVLVRWGLLDQRAFLASQPFLMLWFVFTVLYTGLVVMKWAVFGFVDMQWHSLDTIIPELAAGCITFPIVTAVLHISHKLLPYRKPSRIS